MLSIHKTLRLALFLAVPACLPCSTGTLAADEEYARFSGVYPHLAALSDSYTEAGIGAVVPWADRLWYVSYVAHKSGRRVGLYEITPDLKIRRRPESIVGTHAGRMIHRESNQLIIGPYLIDSQGNVRVFNHLARSQRVTAVARHLTDPDNKVYVQAMEGNLYEADVRTLATNRLFDVRRQLGIRGAAHFKGAYTAAGRLVVANNSYAAADANAAGGRYRPAEGRLAEWDGRTWTVLHRTAFCEVTTARGVHAIPNDNGPLWATGWDKRSLLLAVLGDGKWKTYRLPKGSQAYDHAWCTEWPRIRRCRPGKLMLDMHGLFYEISPEFAPGRSGGLEPIAYHLRIAPDFCPWKDQLVLAGDQNSSMGHRNRTGGQPQSGLWFGNFDELRQWGRPAGWGGPWLDDRVEAGVPSDPFLIKGFTRRSVHLIRKAPGSSSAVSEECSFTLEVDSRGTGKWTSYKTLDVPPGGYAHALLPDEDLGCWMRIVPRTAATVSAMFLFGPKGSSGGPADQGSPLAAFSPAAEKRPRIHGALLPWADRLWFTPYTTDTAGRANTGGGLYQIDRNVKFHKHEASIPGVFANRKIVAGQLSIGPHLIGDDGNVRTFKTLQDEHLVASIRHPNGKRKIYFLTDDGRLLEGDLQTLDVEQVADIPKELGLVPGSLHFRAGHQSGKTVFVAAVAADGHSGCLAEFDGTNWTLIDRSAFGEVADWASMSRTVVAAGGDRASAILKIRGAAGQWTTYRLPKADPGGRTRRPLIREVETERILMQLHGIFYETTGLGYAWFVRPVATHARTVSDFCSWRGLTVMAGGDASAPTGPNYVGGGEGVGLWFGKTDDLWQFGSSRGVGGPWLETPVEAGCMSEPYLMTNFEHKRVELGHDAGVPVRFTLLVDVLGTRTSWKPYKTFTVAPNKTTVHRFPDGYSAHWIRVAADRACRATARFTYE